SMSVSVAGTVPVVLLVDDDAKLLQALRETAGSRSYQIITTTSPSAALQVLRTHPVAVIVVDEVMPEMSGLQLLAVVVKQYPTIGRVVLTGHATVELATRAINEARVHSFLQKPCKASVLRNAIKELLKTRPPGKPDQSTATTSEEVRDRDAATGLYTRQALERLFREQSSTP